MFASKPDRKLERAPLARRAPVVAILRTLILGLFAIVAAAWAIVHHYSFAPPPLRAPVPARPAPTYDADAGETPVPDWLEQEPAGSGAR